MSLGYREETVVSKYYLLQKVQILKTSSWMSWKIVQNFSLHQNYNISIGSGKLIHSVPGIILFMALVPEFRFKISLFILLELDIFIGYIESPQSDINRDSFRLFMVLYVVQEEEEVGTFNWAVFLGIIWAFLQQKQVHLYHPTSGLKHLSETMADSVFSCINIYNSM